MTTTHARLSLRSFSFLSRLGLAAALISAAALAAPAALACGGPFGAGVEVDPAQTIVVGYADGVEYYEFNPSFCGKSADFGLILPIPATLEGKPALGELSLRDELTDLSKPKITTKNVPYCPTQGPPDGVGGGFGGGSGNGPPKGVDVIDGGTVGFLDYEVLKADSEKSLTDFLDANSYPYDDKSKPAFTHYVGKGWFFVAFKVSAGSPPPDGKRLCGALGPIALSFKAAEPVIPTRILFDERKYLWRIYTIANENRGPKLENIYDGELQFAGALSDADLAGRPALAKLAKAGNRVTRFDVGFFGDKTIDDLALPPTATPTADYRAEQLVYNYVKDESLCTGNGGSSGKGGGSAAGTGGSSAGGTSGTGTAGSGAGGSGAAAPAATPSGGDDGCALVDGARSASSSKGLLAGLGLALAAFAARRRRVGAR